MSKQYLVLDNIDQVRRVKAAPVWSVWAKLPDRDDVYLWDMSGIREIPDGSMQINAGEWDAAKLQYINEEWVTPQFVFMLHMCEGCSYPPHMCCLQPRQWEPDWDVEENYQADQEVMESDEYQQAEAELWAGPPVQGRVLIA